MNCYSSSLDYTTILSWLFNKHFTINVCFGLRRLIWLEASVQGKSSASPSEGHPRRLVEHDAQFGQRSSALSTDHLFNYHGVFWIVWHHEGHVFWSVQLVVCTGGYMHGRLCFRLLPHLWGLQSCCIQGNGIRPHSQSVTYSIRKHSWMRKKRLDNMNITDPVSKLSAMHYLFLLQRNTSALFVCLAGTLYNVVSKILYFLSLNYVRL